MTTIVLNTLANAVTHYDWAFQSITPGHAGDATGLYALDAADDDAGLPIAAKIDTGMRMWGASLKQSIATVFVSILGGEQCSLTVAAPTGAWTYPFLVRKNGVSRCPVGRGIRENYLGFALESAGGPPFLIDRIEALDAASTSRRS